MGQLIMLERLGVVSELVGDTLENVIEIFEAEGDQTWGNLTARKSMGVLKLAGTTWVDVADKVNVEVAEDSKNSGV